MRFEDSSLYFEFETITKSAQAPVCYQISGTAHTAKEDVEITRIISIDAKRDYELDFAEELTIDCMIPAGTYLKRIYESRNQLEFTVIKTPVNLDTGEPLTDYQRDERRYVAILREDISSPVIEAQVNAEIDEETLNRTNILKIVFQLIDKTIYDLRLATVGGAYRNITNGELIKFLLTVESQKTSVPKEMACKGVEMLSPDNTAKRSCVVIPHGTKITYLPQFVHEECGGMYTTGFGYFYQDRVWHVYSLYNTRRYDASSKTLTAINTPSGAYPGLNKTYRKDGDNLVVLLTGETKFEDRSDQADITLGNGVRFANADKFMSGYVTVKNNEAFVDRSKNATEVIVEERSDKKNFVPMSNESISANSFVQFSALAARGVSALQVVWENGDPDLLYPGMPVRFMYLDKEDIIDTTGILVKLHAFTHPLEKTMFATKFHTNVVMVLAVERGPTLNK